MWGKRWQIFLQPTAFGSTQAPAFARTELLSTTKAVSGVCNRDVLASTTPLLSGVVLPERARGELESVFWMMTVPLTARLTTRHRGVDVIAINVP